MVPQRVVPALAGDHRAAAPPQRIVRLSIRTLPAARGLDDTTVEQDSDQFAAEQAGELDPSLAWYSRSFGTESRSEPPDPARGLAPK